MQQSAPVALQRSVTIVAVSKQQTATAIMAAHRAGLTHFGESYVQEALPKMDALASLAVTWHFVGRLQANKTRQVAERFDWVHTVDRLRIAERLNEQRPAFAGAAQRADPSQSGRRDAQERRTLRRTWPSSRARSGNCRGSSCAVS